MRRKTGTVVGLLVVVIIASLGWPTQKDEVNKAVVISGEWLNLIDDSNYSASWETAAFFFKQNVDRKEWEKKLHAIRKPMGRLIIRNMTSARYMTSLPGAPDGEYVVIQYKSSFEKKKTAIETATPMKDKDGIWRVSGYFIK